MGSTPPRSDQATPPSIERLAADWLAAEEAASAGDNRGGLEDYARIRSDAYDRAIQDASPEDLLLAWEAARVVQGEQEIGSAQWAAARRVSELLRNEYAAVRPNGAEDDGTR